MTKSLPKLCRQNGWVEDIISSFLYLHQNIDSQLKKHNEEFLTRHLLEDKEYLDRILFDVDPHIVLDEDQRRVVLNEEDHCLVVAGAGAGKTTTVAAKVKYLVDRKNIDPKQILIISYTNKAVDELRDRINKQLKLDCPITTFHSTGNAIIRKNNEFDKTRVFGGGYLYTVVRDYFTNVICNHPSDLKNLILFFGYYITAPFEGDDLQKFFDYAERSDFSTLKGNLGNINKTIIDARTKRKITIRNEVVRSFQEVQIANFLFLNGIEYDYEPIYPYHIESASRVYTPDFIIRQKGIEAYIEHFGITESGKNNRYTPIQLQQYQKSMYDKQAIHHKHRTTLISTFSQRVYNILCK